MAGLLGGVDMRTHRLELLLFRLGENQRFGIDVFKVREVIQCPKLTPVPRAHPLVLGTADTRDQTITVMDLSLAIGGPPIEESRSRFVIVTEDNHRVQGFLVDSVDYIVSLDWDETLPPSGDAEQGTCMTGIAQVEQEPVQIIDVEKLLLKL
jgi:two-component system chemotaxis response regulator CheV